jgi:hypothetical protein
MPRNRPLMLKDLSILVKNPAAAPGTQFRIGKTRAL